MVALSDSGDPCQRPDCLTPDTTVRKRRRKIVNHTLVKIAVVNMQNHNDSGTLSSVAAPADRPTAHYAFQLPSALAKVETHVVTRVTLGLSAIQLEPKRGVGLRLQPRNCAI